MDSFGEASGPNFGYDTDRPERIVWKVFLSTAAVVLLFFAWRCGTTLHSGSALADRAVKHFHAEFNNSDYDAICREGDEGFLQGQRRDDLLRFLEMIHAKLGNADFETPVNIEVKTGTAGTFLISKYTTQFARGKAIETFTWRKSGNTLRLYGYTVQSSELLG